MNDVVIAKNAIQRNKASRIKIIVIAFPIISDKTASFCKKYCQDNKTRFSCTLPENPYSNSSAGAALCEWGNASYAWMLDDLTSTVRLNNFRGDNGASLKAYLQKISTSIPFRERWKDWRFKNRVYVPTCVKNISPMAAAVFMGQYNQKSTHEISHNLKLPHKFVEHLADKILVTLTKNNKLHVLLPRQEISLTGFGLSPSDATETPGSYEHQGHIPYEDANQEHEEQKESVKLAWKKLSCVEQFVLEEMLIENEDAYDVLDSL